MNPLVLIQELGDGQDQPCLDWYSEPEYQPNLDKLTAEKVATTIEVVLHLSGTKEGALDPAAEVERGALLTTTLLGELLGEGLVDGDFAIKVQPVIDLNHQAACDGYQPTDRMRRAVRLARPTEVFPFSTRTGGLDLDHVTSYLTGRRGQTHLHNLAPLTRRVHRAKTAGWWVLHQKGPGHWQWRSPLGYIYEVTDSGTWLTCTPDLGQPPQTQNSPSRNPSGTTDTSSTTLPEALVSPASPALSKSAVAARGR